jgi:hypothetical protein
LFSKPYKPLPKHLGSMHNDIGKLQNLSFEELQKMDVGTQLLQHIQGTELDQKMDRVFSDLAARGFSEREIFQQMLGQQPNADANSD